MRSITESYQQPCWVAALDPTKSAGDRVANPESSRSPAQASSGSVPMPAAGDRRADSRNRTFVRIDFDRRDQKPDIPRRQCLANPERSVNDGRNQEARLEPEPLLFGVVRWSNPLQGEGTLKQVDPKDLRLPPSPIPRPGERVRWHAEAREMAGVVQGHDIRGQAIILDEFGLQHHRSFDDVRLEDPFSRMSPNWCHLPSGGRLLRPGAATLSLFRRIMAERIPPGPSGLICR